MTKQEYDSYVESVDAFFEREKLENLSTGVIRCPQCREFLTRDTCEDCGCDGEVQDEAFFSHSPCDCCGRSKSGSREHASGYIREDNRIEFFTICTDCSYFCTYGQLDDQTMLDIKEDLPTTEAAE